MQDDPTGGRRSAPHEDDAIVAPASGEMCDFSVCIELGNSTGLTGRWVDVFEPMKATFIANGDNASTGTHDSERAHILHPRGLTIFAAVRCQPALFPGFQIIGGDAAPVRLVGDIEQRLSIRCELRLEDGRISAPCDRLRLRQPRESGSIGDQRCEVELGVVPTACWDGPKRSRRQSCRQG